jgi:hypothetical protein
MLYYIVMSDEEVDKYDLQLYKDNILHRIRYIKKFYGFILTREQFLNEWNIIRDDMRILKRKKLIHRFLNLDFENERDVKLYNKNYELFDRLLDHYEFLTSLDRQYDEDDY